MRCTAILLAAGLHLTSAFVHYGTPLTADEEGIMKSHAKDYSENGFNLVATYISHDHDPQDGIEFLEQLGESNTTVQDYFSRKLSNGQQNDIVGRNVALNIDYKCKGHNAIEDHLSQKQIKLICGGLAAISGATVNTLIEIVESKVCVEAGTGHPAPNCKTVVGWIRNAGTGFSTIEVNNFCPDFMSLFVKCKASDAGGTIENGRVDVAAWNTQKDVNCDNADKQRHCKIINA